MESRNEREVNYETLFFELICLNMVITDGTQECEQQIYCTLINVTWWLENVRIKPIVNETFLSRHAEFSSQVKPKNVLWRF